MIFDVAGPFKLRRHGPKKLINKRTVKNLETVVEEMGSRPIVSNRMLRLCPPCRKGFHALLRRPIVQEDDRQREPKSLQPREVQRGNGTSEWQPSSVFDSSAHADRKVS